MRTQRIPPPAGEDLDDERPAITPEHELVPLADYKDPPRVEDEDSEEQTIWFNPEKFDISITLYTETPKPTPGKPPRSYDQRHGTVTRVFKAESKRALPSSFDRQLQQVQCRHTDCMQLPFDCRSREPGHEKQIVGGLAPHLKNMGTQRSRIRDGFVTLSPALDDAAAREKAAEAEEFKLFQRQRMIEREQAKAKADHEKAEKELAERADRDAFQKQRETAAAKAVAEVDAKAKTSKKKSAPADEDEASV